MECISFRAGVSGLSLLEMLVALMILAIALSLAVPSFRGMLTRHRIHGYLEEFVATMWLARSEAIKRGSRVTLCKGDATGCRFDGDWSQGWIVFADLDGNTRLDAGEPLVATRPPLSSATLVGNLHVADYVSFVPTGVARLKNGGFQAGSLVLCASPPVSGAEHIIVLSSIGRIRTDTIAGTRCESR